MSFYGYAHIYFNIKTPKNQVQKNYPLADGRPYNKRGEEKMNNIDKNELFQNSAKNKSTEKDPVFYTSKDVARIMGCSIPTANEIMHRRDFPLITVGRKLKVYKAAFEKWAMEKRI